VRGSEQVKPADADDIHVKGRRKLGKKTVQEKSGKKIKSVHRLRRAGLGKKKMPPERRKKRGTRIDEKGTTGRERGNLEKKHSKRGDGGTGAIASKGKKEDISDRQKERGVTTRVVHTSRIALRPGRKGGGGGETLKQDKNRTSCRPNNADQKKR